MGLIFIFLVPAAIFFGIFFINLLVFREELENITDKPFICPNCGCKFYVKWYRMYFKRYSVYGFKSAKLKCHSCGEVDMCKHDDNWQARYRKRGKYYEMQKLRKWSGQQRRICPVCSALLTRSHSRLSEFILKLKKFIVCKDAVAVMCLCEIVLSVLFIINCFGKCFVISGGNVFVRLSWYDCFVNNSRFNFVLIIIFNILTDIVLLYYVLKKTAVSRLMLFVPAATYIWSLSQFIIRVAGVTRITVYSEVSPSFEITPIGWMIPAVCLVSIALLVFIYVKIRKNSIKAPW